MERLTAELIVVAVVTLTTLAQASNIPWWNIKLAQEQGPNVCVVEEIPGTKHRIHTECKYWNSRQVCDAKPLLRYECCEGFKQVAGTQGCTGVTPLKNLLEMAKQLGAGKFVKYLERTGLDLELSSEGPFTLFAPSDDVFKDLGQEQKARLERGSAEYLRPILHYHMAEGRITSDQFKADLLVPTKYSGHQLRINKYSSRIETVNCALLQRKDQEATNGVVHIIGGLMDPSFTVERDLAELIVQDGRFQELSQALDKSGLMTQLRANDHQYTVLAPSDEAFTKLKPSRLTKILNDKTALQELLENHMLPHVMCTPAIIGEHRVKTFGSNKVMFDCDRTGVKVGGSQSLSAFTLGLNGVFYQINEVLVPDRAKTLIEILEEKKLASFLQLVRFAGLEDAFENYGEYTVFVPSEAAMFALPAETLKSLKNSREKARKFVLFHATQGRLKTNRLNNNQVIMSLNEENPLRIQLYRAGVTTSTGPKIVTAVEGAFIQTADHDCINGVIHIINKALFPANFTATQFLQSNGSYRMFLNALERVAQDSPQLVDNSKAKTYFVPTDEAFQRIGQARLQRIFSDTVYLNKVNEAEAVYSDVMTSSGVVHVIDRVLLPEQNTEF